MHYRFNKGFTSHRESILACINNFNEEGEVFGKAERNTIKLFHFNDLTINIKSFKIPNTINKIAYRFLRKSKAQRSFEYAQYLLSKNIGTPQPIAFVEETSAFAFEKSYYVSEHLNYDITFRELVQQPDYPQHEEILRAFARFTFKLHGNNLEFLDHSPGNTLIQLNNGNHKFFLVDLNRMNFKKLTFEERMKNFARLTPKKDMVETMANEYAQLINKPGNVVFDKMWFYTQDFQKKFRRKHFLKKKLKFWKK